jgi:hypothetical protein
MHGGVLACDDFGGLHLLLVPEGRVAWRIDLEERPTALAATESGHWAAVHARGVTHGHGPNIQGLIELPGAVAACFRDEHTLAVLDESGRLEIHDLRGGARPIVVSLQARCNSLAWSACGWWLVASEKGVHRIDADGQNPLVYLKWSGSPVSALCASPGGGLCAFVTDEHYVVVFGVVKDINCGAIVYPERVAHELEFGPNDTLGVGLGLGDGNKIHLRQAGGVERTDPPPDRPTNRWLIKLGHDTAEIERSLQLEAAHREGRVRFEGSTMIVDPAPAKPVPVAQVTAVPAAQATGQRSGVVIAVVVAVLLLVAGILLVL